MRDEDPALLALFASRSLFRSVSLAVVRLLNAVGARLATRNDVCYNGETLTPAKQGLDSPLTSCYNPGR